MKDEEDEDINDNLEEDDAQENSQEEFSEVVVPSGEHHFYEA